jgi:hypothetical protein
VRTWVRYGGPDAGPVTTDGPHPETSDTQFEIITRELSAQT